MALVTPFPTVTPPPQCQTGRFEYRLETLPIGGAVRMTLFSVDTATNASCDIREQFRATLEHADGSRLVVHGNGDDVGPGQNVIVHGYYDASTTVHSTRFLWVNWCEERDGLQLRLVGNGEEHVIPIQSAPACEDDSEFGSWHWLGIGPVPFPGWPEPQVAGYEPVQESGQEVHVRIRSQGPDTFLNPEIRECTDLVPQMVLLIDPGRASGEVGPCTAPYGWRRLQMFTDDDGIAYLDGVGARVLVRAIPGYQFAYECLGYRDFLFPVTFAPSPEATTFTCVVQPRPEDFPRDGGAWIYAMVPAAVAGDLPDRPDCWDIAEHLVNGYDAEATEPVVCFAY